MSLALTVSPPAGTRTTYRVAAVDLGIKAATPTAMAARGCLVQVLPATATALYAKNLLAFVETLIDPKTKSLAIKWDDELVKATLLTKDGGLVHPSFRAGDEAASTTEFSIDKKSSRRA